MRVPLVGGLPPVRRDAALWRRPTRVAADRPAGLAGGRTRLARTRLARTWRGGAAGRVPAGHRRLATLVATWYVVHGRRRGRLEHAVSAPPARLLDLRRVIRVGDAPATASRLRLGRRWPSARRVAVPVSHARQATQSR